MKSSNKAIKRNKKEPIVGILHEANDWKIDSDLPEFQRDSNEFVFPFWICPTDLKPDCVIFSMQRKICIILEMTVPMDVSIENGILSNLKNTKSIYSKWLTRIGQYMCILLKSVLEVS